MFLKTLIHVGKNIVDNGCNKYLDVLKIIFTT